MNNSAVQLTLDANYGEALVMLEQAIKADPNVAKYHRNLSALFERMKLYDDALNSARTAGNLAPFDPSVLDQLCPLELAKGDPAAALGCFEKHRSIAKLDTLSETYYGIALFRNAKAEDALLVLESAAQSAQPLADTMNALGVIYYTKKRLPEAVNALKRAVEIAPDAPGLRFNLAIAQFSLGNKAAAVSQYNILKSDNSDLADLLYRMLYRDKVVSMSDLKSKVRR